MAEGQLDIATPTALYRNGVDTVAGTRSSALGIESEKGIVCAEARAEEGMTRCTEWAATEYDRRTQDRLKRYREENNEWQTVEVYRYRCAPQRAAYGNSNHFPLGLCILNLLADQHLNAVHMNGWGWSSYLRLCHSLGVGRSSLSVGEHL